MGIQWREITLRRQEGTVVFDLDGHCCLCDAGYAEIETLVETVARFGYGRIKLNLERIRCLDSAALGCLMRAVGRAKQHGAPVTFLNPQPLVLKLLEVTNLTSFLDETYSPDVAR